MACKTAPFTLRALRWASRTNMNRKAQFTLGTIHRTFASSPTLSSQSITPKILLEDKDTGYGFVRHNPLEPKPRSKAVTEIRGPYYTVMGPRYLSDVLETMGAHVDGLKFAGGSFSLFPEDRLRELIDLAHAHDVYVGTGGWVEHILSSSGGDVEGAVDRYLSKCKDVGFDVIELGIQFGAGGDTAAAELESMGSTSDPSKVINMAKEFVAAGVERMMIESEGITENVKAWRTDVIQAVLRELPMEKVMFEAADPAVFNW
ncbi:sulfonate biosynthesis enzyme [Xylariomycetidae sp. FL2044]|nr:sulfonate biosynthesis enzyme [Xylariomycetidae sp. FL2044]